MTWTFLVFANQSVFNLYNSQNVLNLDPPRCLGTSGRVWSTCKDFRCSVFSFFLKFCFLVLKRSHMVLLVKLALTVSHFFASFFRPLFQHGTILKNLRTKNRKRQTNHDPNAPMSKTCKKAAVKSSGINNPYNTFS